MVKRTQDFILPFRAHLGYITASMKNQPYDHSKTLTKSVNEFDFAPGEIIFHGIHALYRAASMLEEPNQKFRDIPMPRKDDFAPLDELLELYREAIDYLESELNKIDDNDLEKDIVSPLNGKPTPLKIWLSASLMHSIHHIAQGVRLSGINGRIASDTKPTYKTASDYQPLYS